MSDLKIMPLSRHSSVLVFLFFVLVAVFAAPEASAQTVAGSISAVTGTATIMRGSMTIPATDGLKVDVGDRIVTGAGSNVSVMLADGSQMEITDSSNLTIDQNTLNPDGSRASTRVSLLGGMVRSLVRSTPGRAPNFEVRTPNAVASARGTSYDVDYHKD
jgi:hypothetical protein